MRFLPRLLPVFLLVACAPEPEGGICRSWSAFAAVGTVDDPVSVDELQAIAADLAVDLDAECSVGEGTIHCLFQGSRDQAECEAAIAAVDVDTGDDQMELGCAPGCEL